MRKSTVISITAIFIVILAIPLLAAAPDMVKSGDSLSFIAEQFDISPQGIAARNNISDVNNILAGQVLTLPNKTETAIPLSTYTVKRGDSLSLIARRFALSLDELATRNNIRDPNTILVGQVLVLPNSTGNIPKTAQQHAGQRHVASARNFAGAPYRWGGLSSRGIDCSGLVVRMMEMEGMRVPHRAAELYKLGKEVPLRELRAGDLVFFNITGKGVSHVGVWIGKNEFIHASSSRGVVVDEMKGYFSKRLVGARRLH